MWKNHPDLTTLATIMSKSSLLCIEWASKIDKVVSQTICTKTVNLMRCASALCIVRTTTLTLALCLLFLFFCSFYWGLITEKFDYTTRNRRRRDLTSRRTHSTRGMKEGVQFVLMWEISPCIILTRVVALLC